MCAPAPPAASLAKGGGVFMSPTTTTPPPTTSSSTTPTTPPTTTSTTSGTPTDISLFSTEAGLRAQGLNEAQIAARMAAGHDGGITFDDVYRRRGFLPPLGTPTTTGSTTAPSMTSATMPGAKPVTISGEAKPGGTKPVGTDPNAAWAQSNAELRRIFGNRDRATGDYLSPDPRYFDSYTDEGGNVRWTPKAEYSEQGMGLNENDPLVQQFLKANGQRTFLDERGVPILLDDGQPRYFVGYQNPYGDLQQDENYVLRLPDGRMVWDRANQRSWEMDDRQRAQETENRREQQQYGRTVATFFGPAVAGAFGFNAPGGDMNSVMGAAPGEGFGTATGGAGSFGSAGIATQDPAPVFESQPPSYPPGTQAPAPVFEASPASRFGFTRPAFGTLARRAALGQGASAVTRAIMQRRRRGY